MKPEVRPFVQTLSVLWDGPAVQARASKGVAVAAVAIVDPALAGLPPGKACSCPPRKAPVPAVPDGGAGGGGGSNASPRRIGHWAKGVAAAIGAAYVHEKVGDDFFLSTTTLNDGKRGFTGNARLALAQEDARAYRQRYLAGAPAQRMHDNRPPTFVRRVGNNEFATMVDFRAATKVHLAETTNTPEAYRSLSTSLDCFTGRRIRPDVVARYKPSQVPAEFDLTKSARFREKNHYALTGVPNEETGASGYASRSVTHPFLNNGMQHYKDESEARGLSPEQCQRSFEAALEGSATLSPAAQFAAGQFILNLRQVYAADEHWGHSENVVMADLKALGLLSQAETDKIDATLLFEDPSKNVLKRNTSLAGPRLHKIDTGIQSIRLRNDPEALADIKAMVGHKNIENLPIVHFKLNEEGNGFEDCSGLGDSFTSANATACMNHARLMSGEERLSRYDVGVIVACLNAVYDDASSLRHTLREIARGCFVGAGYTTEDADHFYADLCSQASQEFYGGKKLPPVAAADLHRQGR
ncbi:XopAG/AvrGf1 family type III secretion system effector [Xylophilus ampelinus]|uniref:Type III effector HopG1 n=1 Tax=Xylophilus ampelinus TaxID=54067 RepID=A0A318SQZ3_9BURK|nr:XopAG/AvrGf1 family type III secretion system effector [Xylophilus ampelinus]MCS4511256.1 type III effector HopG1 [Xylophilus ampelinus]PYE74990.1 hypothetical protein DFQ15_12111 [Xylophilus ampelinus]